MKFRNALILLVAALPAFSQPRLWTPAEANQWYGREPWLVGANFIPSTASNQLEMWQDGTFDPLAIDKELEWAESMGMNTVRVFLHDMLWTKDSSGFEKRINVFLRSADKHRIKPIFVLLDSRWDPFPEIGPQLPPKPGVRNSRWVQSPRGDELNNPKKYDKLLAYVQGITTSAFWRGTSGTNRAARPAAITARTTRSTKWRSRPRCSPGYSNMPAPPCRRNPLPSAFGKGTGRARTS